MKRKASAIWTGGLKDGRGTISTESGVLSETQYSFGARFENGVGTNPEELIGAAHAGCFSMALSGQLGAAGMTAERISTTATVSLEKQEAGFAITESTSTDGQDPRGRRCTVPGGRCTPPRKGARCPRRSRAPSPWKRSSKAEPRTP